MRNSASAPLVILGLGLILSSLPAPLSRAQEPPQPELPHLVPLKDSFKNDFLIGTAISYQSLQGRDEASLSIAQQHFSAFTPENSLKPDSIERTEGEFRWRDADRLVELAQQNGTTVVGHTLVWHQQTPRWFFQGADGQLASREVALARLRQYIATVVGRYKGRIKQWDVVNEALSDNPNEYLRSSPWLQTIGEDYIAQAFRAAHEADPDAILIYNDYNNERGSKADKTLRLVKSLLDQGVPIHAVGMQCHWRLDRPPIEETEATIQKYAALGVKVMVTELDIGVLQSRNQGADISTREAGNDALNPYVNGLPAEIAKQQADLYGRAFAMFLRHKDVVKRVTIWGVTDATSWLNNYPIRGRTDYPLLFDRDGKPKAAFFAVQQAASLQNAASKSP